MKCKILLTALSLALASNAFAKVESIMLANVDMREAKLWVKAKPNDSVEIKIKEIPDFISKVQTDEFGVANARLFGLAPATTYNYSVSDSENSIEASVSTLDDYISRKAPENFSVAILGRNIVNDEAYDLAYQINGGEYEIYDQVLAKKPIVTIWANGIDTLRNADFSSKSGFYGRFIHSRKQENLQNLLRGTSNIGVMSIDNYGPPRADGTMYNKDVAQEAFMKFWQNPSFGNTNNESNAMYSQFRIYDAEFFIIDDCSFRDNLEYKNKKRTFLGTKQINFLCQALNASTANFKVLVMNTAIANPNESYNNFSDAKAEKATLLERIENLKIEGVICVSGNKEFAEITRMIRSSSYPIYDITAGPLTAKAVSESKELNYFRVPGSAIFKRTFTILNFSGKEDNRVLNVGFIDSKGEVLFRKTIDLKELSNATTN